MTLEPLTNEELAAVIVPWAEEKKPELIGKLHAEIGNPNVYRRLLGRLIEMCWAENAEGRELLPMLALHESALVLAYQFRTSILRVSGRYAPKPWQWTFAELAQLIASHPDKDDLCGVVATLHDAKTNLDLFHATTIVPSARAAMPRMETITNTTPVVPAALRVKAAPAISHQTGLPL